jgi:predicted transcriptional regulator
MEIPVEISFRNMDRSEALEAAIRSKVGSLVVVDDSKTPIGIITERD